MQKPIAKSSFLFINKKYTKNLFPGNFHKNSKAPRYLIKKKKINCKKNKQTMFLKKTPFFQINSANFFEWSRKIYHKKRLLIEPNFPIAMQENSFRKKITAPLVETIFFCLSFLSTHLKKSKINNVDTYGFFRCLTHLLCLFLSTNYIFSFHFSLLYFF